MTDNDALLLARNLQYVDNKVNRDVWLGLETMERETRDGFTRSFGYK